MKKKYVISLLCHNNLELTKKCVDSILKFSDDYLLVITDNASTDGTQNYITSLHNENIHFYLNSENIGYGLPHNAIAEKYVNSADYLVILNNDLVVCSDWLRIMSSSFEENTAIVGVKNTCNSLTNEGIGFLSTNAEYIEGSCLMIKTDLVKKHGLFSEEYKFAYCEDADMSLRYRELGYTIKQIPLNIVHHRASTTNLVKNTIDIEGYITRNKYTLLNKWKHYLKRRNFNYTILIRRTAAKGDVLLTTPIIRALKKKWKDCNISVQTSCPNIFKNNSDVSTIILSSVNINPANYDFYYDLDNSYERIPTQSILSNYAAVCGLSLEEIEPNLIFFTERVSFLLPDKYIVIHPGTTAWAGRNWYADRWTEIVNKVKYKGYKVILIGDKSTPSIKNTDIDLRDKLSIHQLADIIGKSKFFIGIDSFPFHIAQSQNIPGVIFFGCILPKLRIIKDNIIGINASELGCIGCHHWITGTRNCNTSCMRGKEECMDRITIDRMWGVIDKCI